MWRRDEDVKIHFFFIPYLSSVKYSTSGGCFMFPEQKFSHNPVTADTPSSWILFPVSLDSVLSSGTILIETNMQIGYKNQ